MTIITGRAVKRLGYGHLFKVVDSSPNRYVGSIILTLGRRQMFILDSVARLGAGEILAAWKYEYIGQLRKQ